MEVGAKVVWEMRGVKHTGVIVMEVPAGGSVKTAMRRLRESGVDFIGGNGITAIVREHVSWLVIEPTNNPAAKPKLYWPKTHKLMRKN